MLIILWKYPSSYKILNNMLFLSRVVGKDNIFEGELAVSNYIINNIICLKTKYDTNLLSV